MFPWAKMAYGLGRGGSRRTLYAARVQLKSTVSTTRWNGRMDAGDGMHSSVADRARCTHARPIQLPVSTTRLYSYVRRQVVSAQTTYLKTYTDRMSTNS